MNFNDIKDIKDLTANAPDGSAGCRGKNADHSGTGAGKTDHAGPCDRWTETIVYKKLGLKPGCGLW